MKLDTLSLVYFKRIQRSYKFGIIVNDFLLVEEEGDY